jgi:hypothetical protein
LKNPTKWENVKEDRLMSRQTIEGLAKQNALILWDMIEGAQKLLEHTKAAKKGYKSPQTEIDQMRRTAKLLGTIPELAADNIKRMAEIG